MSFSLSADSSLHPRDWSVGQSPRKFWNFSGYDEILARTLQNFSATQPVKTLRTGTNQQRALL